MGKTTTYLGRVLGYYLIPILLALLLSSAIYLNAFAKEKPESKPGQTAKLQDKKRQGQDQNTISNQDIKVFLKQIEIYGQIAKPQTVFIIPGTDPRVDGLRIDRHFFSHIFRPVEKSTLRRVRIKQGKDKDHILW